MVRLILLTDLCIYASSEDRNGNWVFPAGERLGKVGWCVHFYNEFLEADEATRPFRAMPPRPVTGQAP